jgi:prophage antirepressor-like protein
MDEKKIYKCIPDTKNIIMKLVSSINTDETFQKHVSKLSNSIIEKDNNKALLINQTIHNIKVFNTKVRPLFLAKDIGILMGISQINVLIRKFEPEEKIIGYIKNNNKIKKVIFLTRHGIYRCFFASRSPLAKLFRKFICNLVDHMIEHEAEIMNKISKTFQIENPELIEQGMNDLQNKLKEYQIKLLEEEKKSQMLEEQYENERKERIKFEEENTETEIINSYSMMQIKQLEHDKNKYISTIKTIQENFIEESNENLCKNTFIDDASELKMLKEKFMKPIYIHILHPVYFIKLLKNKHKELSVNNNFTDNSNTIEQINYLINDKIYLNNFHNIFSKSSNIETDELLYYYISFVRDVSKENKIINISKQWVMNKKHFSHIINSLENSCECINFTNINIYKTSIGEIIEIIKEEIINI